MLKHLNQLVKQRKFQALSKLMRKKLKKELHHKKKMFPFQLREEEMNQLKLILQLLSTLKKLILY